MYRLWVEAAGHSVREWLSRTVARSATGWATTDDDCLLTREHGARAADAAERGGDALRKLAALLERHALEIGQYGSFERPQSDGDLFEVESLDC